MRIVITSSLFTTLFFLIGLVLFIIVVPPCGISSFFLNDHSCTAQNQRFSGLYDEEIFNLELELNAVKQKILSEDCVYDAFLPQNVEYKAAAPQVDPTKLTDQEVSGFESRDLSAMAGCWQLSGSSRDYSPTSCTLGLACPYLTSDDEIYCFGQDGLGAVTTNFDGGACEGKIKASFNSDISDDIELLFDTDNQKCDGQLKHKNGQPFGFIEKMSYSCQLTAASRVECKVTSRRGYNQVKVVLKRVDNANR